MKRFLALFSVFVPVLVLTGCVDRRYVIQSDPPGALVLRNGQPIGCTPVDDHFTYYGKYDFTLIKDGYETQKIEQDICAPWYEYPLIDFFTENLIPFKIRDVRRFNYQMQPVKTVRTDEVLQRAEQLRTQGQSIGAPRAIPPHTGPAPQPTPSAPLPTPSVVPPQPPTLSPPQPQ